MFGGIYHGKVSEDFNKIKYSLSERSEYGIFLTSANTHFQAREIEVIFEAFKGWRGIMWHAWVSKVKEVNQEKVWEMFGDYNTLHKSILNKSVKLTATNEWNFKSASAWLDESNFADLARLLQKYDNNKLAISFIPDVINVANAWFLIAEGLSWNLYLKGYSFLGRMPAMNAQVIRSYPMIELDYITLTQNIGGLPVFICDAPDTNVKRLLLILGSEDKLLPVVARLKEFYQTIPESEFQDWLERGITIK